MTKLRPINYRLCVPSLKFIDIDPQTNKITGFLRKPAKAVLDLLISTHRNVTLIRPDEESEPTVHMDKNNLPGCWGALQRGEADVYLYPNKMPIVGLENITQLNASSIQSGTYMLAPYSKNERSEVLLRPLDSLRSLSVDSWANAAVMVIIFVVIMHYLKLFVYRGPGAKGSSNDARKEDEALHGQSLVYQVITHMMQYETCDYTGDTVRYVSLLMSIFAFLFITLFSCMITCDKVSTHDIQVYDTYDKILANKSVQPVWIEHLNDYPAYKRAPKGSLQAQIWEQSIAISKKYPDKPPFVSTSPESIAKRLQTARNKDLVLFISNVLADVFIRMMCAAQATDNLAVKAMKDLRPKARLDEQVAPYLYALPASVHSNVTAQIDSSCRRMLEGHLLSQPDLVHMTEMHLAKDVLSGKISYNEDYYQCLNFEKLPSSESETAPLSLTNAGDVFRWWAYGCFASLIALLLENSCHQEYQLKRSGSRSDR